MAITSQRPPSNPANPTAPSSPRRVLFVDEEDAARTQMAKAFTRAFGGGRIEVRSAGTRPLRRVMPQAIQAMDERGLDIRQQRSRAVDPAYLEGALVVTMGTVDPALFPRNQVVTWDTPDPCGHDTAFYRAVREDLGARTRHLVDQGAS